MTELQEKLLPILEWFHEFCAQNDLRYYALGGTALGAVRHGGFIPWDDDIDVGMPRLDYERFMQLTANKTFAEKYVCEFPLVTKKYYYAFAKIYDITTTLIENKRHKQKKGVYIDVFPLDGLGDSEQDALTHFKAIDSIFNRYNAKTCAIRKERSFYKNLAIIAMRCIPEFIYGTDKLMQKLESKRKEFDYDNSEFICNTVGAWHEKEIAKKAVFGSPKTMQFENAFVNVPEDTDAYLSKMYGDYMIPPPVEKQKSHHDYLYLDLNKGYLDKIEQ